jgi:hypothetical protein
MPKKGILQKADLESIAKYIREKEGRFSFIDLYNSII